MAKQGLRKKIPRELAVINADHCTGCETCLEVCPVDCIKLKTFDRSPAPGRAANRDVKECQNEYQRH